jgi:hypothetical protein
MARPIRYEAVWAPGLRDTTTADEDDASLDVAFAWLADAERRFGRRGQIVMYAKQMMHNRPKLTEAAYRWPFHSPRSHAGWNLGPTIAVWPPDDQTLELAENVAGDTGLCVIPGQHYDAGPWIFRTGAHCLIDGWSAPAAPELDKEVTDRLDSILSFDGHNGFIGGGGKEHTISTLQEIARMRPHPTRDEIEGYLRASGETHEPGPERAGEWYEEILNGRRHLDYRRQVIGRPLRRGR